MAVEHPLPSPDKRFMAEADDLAVQSYEIACDDLEPEVMRLLTLEADESLIDLLDALTAEEE
jgi:hypothetical protein